MNRGRSSRGGRRGLLLLLLWQGGGRCGSRRLGPEDGLWEEHVVDLVNGELFVRVEGAGNGGVINACRDGNRVVEGGDVEGVAVLTGITRLGAEGVADGLELGEGDE